MPYLVSLTIIFMWKGTYEYWIYVCACESNTLISQRQLLFGRHNGNLGMCGDNLECVTNEETHENLCTCTDTKVFISNIFTYDLNTRTGKHNESKNEICIYVFSSWSSQFQTISIAWRVHIFIRTNLFQQIKFFMSSDIMTWEDISIMYC